MYVRKQPVRTGIGYLLVRLGVAIDRRGLNMIDEKHPGRVAHEIAQRPRKSLLKLTRWGLIPAAMLCLVAVAGARPLDAQSKYVRANNPQLSSGLIYASAVSRTRGKLRVRIMGVNAGDVYTLAYGSTQHHSLRLSAKECPFSGGWNVWVMASKDGKDDYSPSHLYFRCKTGSPFVEKQTR